MFFNCQVTVEFKKVTPGFFTTQLKGRNKAG